MPASSLVMAIVGLGQLTGFRARRLSWAKTAAHGHRALVLVQLARRPGGGVRRPALADDSGRWDRLSSSQAATCTGTRITCRGPLARIRSRAVAPGNGISARWRLTSTRG